jgi:hypothetical protein
LAEDLSGMKRFTTMVVTISLAGACCVVACTVAAYYYCLYRGARTELEERLSHVETQVNGLWSWHEFRDLVPSRFQARIRTVWEPDTNSVFEVAQTKEGAILNGTLEIGRGTTERRKFTVRTERGYGRHPVEAWILRAEPSEQLALFKEFRVYCPKHTNVVEVVAQAKTNVLVDMEFTVVLFREVP